MNTRYNLTLKKNKKTLTLRITNVDTHTHTQTHTSVWCVLSYRGHGEHTFLVLGDSRFLCSLLLLVQCETFPDS